MKPVTSFQEAYNTIEALKKDARRLRRGLNAIAELDFGNEDFPKLKVDVKEWAKSLVPDLDWRWYGLEKSTGEYVPIPESDVSSICFISLADLTSNQRELLRDTLKSQNLLGTSTDQTRESRFIFPQLGVGPESSPSATHLTRIFDRIDDQIGAGEGLIPEYLVRGSFFRDFWWKGRKAWVENYAKSKLMKWYMKHPNADLRWQHLVPILSGRDSDVFGHYNIENGFAELDRMDRIVDTIPRFLMMLPIDEVTFADVRSMINTIPRNAVSFQELLMHLAKLDYSKPELQPCPDYVSDMLSQWPSTVCRLDVPSAFGDKEIPIWLQCLVKTWIVPGSLLHRAFEESSLPSEQVEVLHLNHTIIPKKDSIDWEKFSNVKVLIIDDAHGSSEELARYLNMSSTECSVTHFFFKYHLHSPFTVMFRQKLEKVGIQPRKFEKLDWNEIQKALTGAI